MYLQLVVPFAGTWIETICFGGVSERDESFPSRERGLKPFFKVLNAVWAGSFPSRERGLKQLGV